MRARIPWATLVGLLALVPADARPPVAKKLQPFIDRQQISGAVTLLGDKEEVLSVETIGAADLGTSRPMTPDTLFWIASITKSVTGTAVMMLVDEGKISVDDPSRNIFPNSRI